MVIRFYLNFTHSDLSKLITKSVNQNINNKIMITFVSLPQLLLQIAY